jgi:hypothetical protein
MLLSLAEFLMQFYRGFAVFQYLTLRGILGVLTALLIAFVVGPAMIRRLSLYKVGQQVRQDGPRTHLTKAGTPTMGGSLILVAVAVSTLLWSDLTNRFVWIVLMATLLFGLIGGVDDSTLYVPVFKDVAIELGPWFILLAWFVIVGTSNAVNLTDGLDGLAILPTVMVGGALGVFAYAAGHAVFADYLGIPSVPGVGELVVFTGAMVGAGLGFLWFNTPIRPRSSWATWARWRWARRWGAGHRHPPGDRAGDHGRRVRGGDPVGDPAGGLLQAHRAAHLPHGAPASPFRTQGLARAAGHRALLDHHRDPGAGGAGHPEAALGGRHSLHERDG